MEKILKRILLSIPILLISFSFKSVKAEDPINIYFDVSNATRNNYSSSPTSDSTYSSNVDFKLYEDNFKFNIYPKTRKYYNSFILYNKVEKYYIFNVIVPASSVPTSSTDNSIYMFCSNYSQGQPTSSGFKIVKNDSSLVQYANNSWPLLISNYNASDKWSNLSSSFTIDSYNFYYNSTSVSSARYYCDNINDFDLVYIDKDKFYVDNVEKEVFIPEEPEVPEEPEKEKIDLHYFYVPNYNENMCVEVLDKDTIRVFENENSIDYIDYYINSNYISKTGQVRLDYIKNCSNLKFSSIEYYRNDFPKILFITIVIFGSSVLFLYVLYKRFRKR